MRKHVNISAHAMITDDSNIMLDEISVPKSIAMMLTYPE
jgi:DNA-directed RNA polymerase beta' subunit